MKTNPKFQLLLIALLLSACTSDFISPNLEKKKLLLLSPPDRYTSIDPSVLFWCEELKGATGYRLQIVDSSFSFIRKLVLDSLVTAPRSTFVLPPGKYQWRMRAENNASVTPYTDARRLVVDSTYNLSGVSLQLLAPGLSSVYNSTGISFTWTKMYSATDYRFQLFKNNSTLADIILTDDSTYYSLSEGQYTWQVRAQNASSNSAYSSATFSIDLTVPAVSTQSSPAQNAFVASPVALIWARDQAAVGDSLFIYPDSLLSPAVYSSYTVSTSYNYTGISGQSYFWRLRSRDAAGNWSTYGTVRKFRVL